MKLSILAVVATISSYALAAPASTHVVHEKRELASEKWTKRDVKLNRDAIIPLSIGLKQRNLDSGYEFLMDVSHPESPNFGKHWSPEKVSPLPLTHWLSAKPPFQIKHTFSPSPETIAAIKEWLIQSGIENERIQASKSRTWIKLNATVEEAESLLHTEYNIYTNVDSGKEHLACNDYSLPSHLREHVDFIQPTVHFDAIVKPVKQRRDLQGREIVKPSTHSRPGKEVGQAAAVKYTLANCYEYVTPDCLRALYNVPNGTLAKLVLTTISQSFTYNFKVVLWYRRVHSQYLPSN